MEINYNEFGIHPLVFFPHNKNLDKNNIDKAATYISKLDGFNIHPIDLFINHGNTNKEQTNFI